jgi:putative hemolysin
MNKNTTICIMLALLLAACQSIPTQGSEFNPTVSPEVYPAVSPPPGVTPTPGLPNPASAYCADQGYASEIRTAADGSQSGVCIFPDGTHCDEWAYFRNECGPASVANPTSTSAAGADGTPPAPTGIPTPLPIDPADYQGWWTYTHAMYNFSIMLPEDWIVEEAPTSDLLLSGHMLNLRPRDEVDSAAIRMTFRRLGEDTLLWPTGVGQGEFVTGGTLDVAGAPARRLYLVCPTGQVTSIWYHGGENEANIIRGEVEFGFIFGLTGDHCPEDASLGGKVQRVGEMIIASLEL